MIFRSRDLEYDLKEFDGRSDYGPFIAAGVDIPGIFIYIYVVAHNNIVSKCCCYFVCDASLQP